TIPRLPEGGQRRLQMRDGRIVIPLLAGEAAGTVERLGTFGRAPAAPLQDRLEAPAPLDEMAARPPEAPERAGQAHRRPRVVLLHPVERLAEVGVLDLEPVEPRLLIRPRQLRLRLLHQAEAVRRMPVPNDRFLPTLRQTRQTELPNRLQHGEP